MPERPNKRRAGNHHAGCWPAPTTRIADLHPTESDAVQRQLFTYIAKPEHTVRWRWKLGDIAFWDNRLTQHYATADYLPARRVMHRATIMGDAPYYQNNGFDNARLK